MYIEGNKHCVSITRRLLVHCRTNYTCTHYLMEVICTNLCTSIQSVTEVSVTTPRVDSGKAYSRTLKRKSSELSLVQELVSKAMPSVQQLQYELKTFSLMRLG